ncbi:MAG TPA: biotin transporter BioY [Candidatus Limnocylindrales bacterium]|jgi:biotin transport system substrate-specific component|nr:biotin transporter BioY [Candidatus Limnocylindrales bacterium]
MIASGRLVRLPPFERGLTLGDFLVPVRIGERLSSPARHAVLIVLGALLIVVGARISFYLPDDPVVPVTLQTFGVLFGGALLGFRRGLASIGLYLLLGFAGLPVFAYDAADHVYRSGIGTVASFQGGGLSLGPTGGYLIGFLLAAAVVGRLAELGWDRNVVGSIAALVLGEVAIYAVGLPWLAASAHLGLADTLKFGLTPFLLGDLLKLAVAAGLLPVGWWAVRRRPSDR